MIKNKKIWITGASSGIGMELVKLLAKNNNTVVASARSADKLDALALECKACSGQVIPLPYDVTDDNATTLIRQQLQLSVDSLDIVVLCAGCCEYVDDTNLQVDMFRRVYDVNVFGSINATAVAMPLLQSAASDPARDGKPQIVAVASLSTVTGLPRAEAYGSSKAAMIYLFNTLRLDLQKQIEVTIVNPGFVATPMTSVNDFPMPFMMQPDEAAQCIVNGVAKRKLTVNFPLRLWLSLKLPSLIPWLWYRVLGPRLVRAGKG